MNSPLGSIQSYPPLQQEVWNLQRSPPTILKETKAHLQKWAVTNSWGLLRHRWWPYQVQQSCRVPDRLCHLFSLLLACQILIYLHSSRLQTCHTCPHKLCPEGPCFHLTDSECPCPSLLVALLSIDILWDQRVWMTGKGGISETRGQGSGVHPSTEGGGRVRFGPKTAGGWITATDTNKCQDI